MYEIENCRRGLASSFGIRDGWQILFENSA